MTTDNLNRGYGIMIIEAVCSNINGDPDLENDPRHDSDEYGMVTGVSIHRKLRDLVEDKEGAAWQQMRNCFGKDILNPEVFDILEKRGRNRSEIKQLSKEAFQKKFWDARLFGSTFLEEKASFISTGVVHFTIGRSVAPLEIMRMTLTNKAGVEVGKDRGMAPLGLRISQHALYVVPFHVNPAYAHITKCTKTDLDLMFKLLPHIYTATASMVRSDVRIRHIWYAEHKTPLGSCPEHLVYEAMLPTKKENPEIPSTRYTDYIVPTELPKALKDRLVSFADLAL